MIVYPEKEMYCEDVKELPYGVKFNPGPKLFIPISCNGSGDGKTAWALSLATSFNGRHVQMENMGGSHADRACNNMANRFLRTDCDVMFIIDIDTEFRKQDIDRALSHIARGVKAVWGLYPKKQDDAPPCVNTWPEVLPPDEFGLVNVRRAGRGFLCVTREVFNRLCEENLGPARKFFNHDEPEHAFFHSGIVEGERSAMLHGEPEWISEDWMFCEDLRIHLGIPTLVDTGIVLAHVGSKTYRFPAEKVTRMDNNITSWKEIHGWFDYEEFYRFLVKEIPVGGTFVEVGSWLGRSLGAFDSFAKEAGKTIELHAVDTFQGRPENATHRAILEAHGGSVEDAFIANMEALKVSPNIYTIDSVGGATHFEDASRDAVFIDAAHDYESVRADILAWLPKVKPGGILGGHDADEDGVSGALRDLCTEGKMPLPWYETMGRCWYVRV